MQLFTFAIIAILLSFPTYGQNSKVVKGIATDKAGTPIPFCNVSIKGTQIATTTNSCGEFELTTGQNDYTIIFHCVSTHDFIAFERKVKQKEIPNGDTIVFQLKKHGKILNKECKQKVSKKLHKLIVK